MLSLFRRRQVWLPTLLGWLVLLSLAVAACLVAARLVHPFLAPNDPAPQARILVIEGWMTGHDLDQAIAAARNGRYERILTAGGPIERWLEFRGASNYAEWSANYLRTHGLADANVIAVPTPASEQNRTFLSALTVRDWAARQGLALTALDVYTSGVHARRSRMLYRKAFGPEVDVGVLAARPREYDERHWWRTSAGARTVLGESISLLWTVCCFRPSPSG